MLAVSDLSVSIGATAILHGVSFDVPTGSVCGLIGRNGAGKTTLMRSLMGILPARGGGMRFDDADLAAAPAQQRVALGIGYMPEDRRLIPEFTAQENVMLPVWAAGLREAEARLAWIYKLMPEVQAFRDRRATQLSGGQQKLTALARALMGGRRLLLLDEPFEGVAPVLARRLAEVLADLKREGLSLLIADSSAVHLEGLLDRSLVIERGHVQAGAAA
ncbi:MAG: ATP-binding cassette domain-containing protein [Alphaproteobacteria bacterium]|nr:ATP-binding cassette domain-containing protein [Alphaproteobacteria bacterium]